MGTYSKGASYERELLELLKRRGFAAVRVAGSGRARMEQPDLLASNGEKTFGIECKYSGTKYKTITKEEVNALVKFCKEFGCTALLAYRFPHTEWKFKIITDYTNENVSVKKSDNLLTINQIV
jgi:Holliday junction resolvase